MATDFFDRQDEARRRTGRLVVYFIVAVVIIILAVYTAFTAILIASHGSKHGAPPPPLDPIRLAIVATVTGAVILLGSLFKIAALREGGSAVARSLGGRLIDGNTTDLTERRLLNVVEEMALASGTPVPPVYVMDNEHGINAFAAGFAPTDAVIGVTRGTIDHLDRDQLQGVIAHEFSHILNGDMRLDLKLMGTLHGILLLAIVGQILIRIAGNSGSSRSSRNSDSKDNGAMAFLLMGIALYIIGYLGLFFGRLIKCAVSRQREFLADASAVQFTRNPEGIGGALKKIGGLQTGGLIKNPTVEEACHMFFGAAVPSMTSLMATHPPLEERIKRIDPQFDGTFPEVPEEEHVDLADDTKIGKPKPAPGIGGLGAVLPGVNIPGGLGGAVILPAASAVGTIGSPRPQHVEYASGLMASLPREIMAATRDPYSAVSLIYAMLLDDKPDVRQRQLAGLQANAAPGQSDLALRLSAGFAPLGPETRVPLVDLSFPALRGLSLEQYNQFRGNVSPMIRADNTVTLFEYVLERMLFRHLDRQYRRIAPVQVRYTSLPPLADRVVCLLGSLAWIGQDDERSIRAAFESGVSKLGLDGASPALPERAKCSLSAVDSALTELAGASPGIKKRVLDGCAAAISADGRVTVEEGELLRAIADSLDCPMPPLLPGPSPA